MVKRLLLRDALRTWLLFSICLVAGAVLNEWRPRPLPLLYSSPEERLAQAAQKIAPQSAAPLAAGGNIDLDAMRQIVEAQSALVIDARPEIFFRFGHLPGAINLPRDDFEAAYRELGPSLLKYRERLVIVYCSSNACDDSQMVADSLGRLGFAQVRVFRGGWSSWDIFETCRRKRCEPWENPVRRRRRLPAGAPGARRHFTPRCSKSETRRVADAVASYRLLPAAIVNLVALGLPLFELACGMLLLTPRFCATGLLSVISLLGLFLAALLWAMVRKPPVNCGCFGAADLFDASPNRTRARPGPAALRRACLPARAAPLPHRQNKTGTNRRKLRNARGIWYGKKVACPGRV